ncbi:uncharacterized protein A4U43_C08F25660 [Asparagus officinalis]|nr:uncharacterized protein A4U43_C08F25660 [Asparagus officinalis]
MTSQDNRIRVWDSIFGNLDSPSREIVHSQDFNRPLTPFRAEWDPKDPSESLAVIGRCISENYNGVALHPIDFIDTSTWKLVAEVIDPDITTISPVNKLHPRDDVLATGSSSGEVTGRWDVAAPGRAAKGRSDCCRWRQRSWACAVVEVGGRRQSLSVERQVVGVAVVSRWPTLDYGG